MRVTRKYGLVLPFLLLVSVGIFGVASPPVAHAIVYPKCSGPSCKNMDPTATQGPDGVFCNRHAYLQEEVDSVNQPGGYVQNWYSVNCNANWTVAQAPTGYSMYYVYMDLCQGPASGKTCNYDPVFYTDIVPGWACFQPLYQCNAGTIPNGATHWYTNMVDGAYPVQSAAGFTGGVTPLVTNFH